MHGLLSGSCPETEKRMSDHLDGTLTGWAGRRVLRHLARCELCRSVVASLAQTLEELRALGRGDELAAPSLAEAVVARISRQRSAT